MSSKLFDLANSAEEFAEKRRYGRGEARMLRRALLAYSSRRASRRRVERALDEFQQTLDHRTASSASETFASGLTRRAADILRPILGSQWSTLGRILHGLLDGSRGRNLTSDDMQSIRELERLLRGDSRRNTGQVDSDFARLFRQARSGLTSSDWELDSSWPSSDADDRRDTLGSQLRAIRQGEDGQSMERMSKLIRTPGSSNVYSFQYDYAESIMYVRFLAPGINRKSVINYKSKGGVTAMAGDLGSTVRGKTSKPGALYKYHDVPVKVFRKIAQSDSAGKAVWDNLRDGPNGTIYGHRYKYTLVSGATVPGEGGRPALYVPRKATPGGFRGRSVAMPGRGRRGYAGSTLPPSSLGWDSNQSVNRGRPTPPSRGR